MIGQPVARFAAGLRFPAPFALGTLLVGSLRKRREPTPPGTPQESS
jgi:hypothetical protein